MSGLTVSQRELCCERYPDAGARMEVLIDLCIWTATASAAYLETGQVRTLNLMPIPIPNEIPNEIPNLIPNPNPNPIPNPNP